MVGGPPAEIATRVAARASATIVRIIAGRGISVDLLLRGSLLRAEFVRNRDLTTYDVRCIDT